MATKPAEVPTWATDSTYSGGAYNGQNTKSAPGATLKAQGYEPNIKPTAQNFNDRLNLIGRWLQYVNDGDFTGAATFASTVGITGILTATGLINANGGITCASGQHGVVSGAGKWKHGDKKITQNVAPEVVTAGTYVASVGGGGAGNAVVWTLSTGGGTVFIPLRALQMEHRIKAVTIYATATNEPTITIVDQVLGNSANLTTTDTGGPITSTSLITKTLNSPITPFGPGEVLWVKVVSGSSTCVMRQIEILFDYP